MTASENEKSRSTETEKISLPEIKKALMRSGYLLEQRVASVMNDHGYDVVTNRGFVDQETKKSREYDVYAYKDIRLFNSDSCDLYPTLVCECKNNPQPITFFAREKCEYEPLLHEVNVSGLPTRIFDGPSEISIQEHINVNSFHHYCRPEVPVATQCCTFEMKKDKSSWMANRGEELNETFRTLTKALENEIDDDFINMHQHMQLENIGKERIDLSFYYPLVIYQGEISVAFLNDIDSAKTEIKVDNLDHVQFNPEFLSNYNEKIISYHIDVIRETYLKEYLKLIDREMAIVSQALEKNRWILRNSADKLSKMCNEICNSPSSMPKQQYRKILESNFQS